MKNILGTTENLGLFNKEGKKVYEFYTYPKGYSCEYTYNEKGNILTYKDSKGVYRIRGQKVTKEEYETFINGTPEYIMEELVNKLGHNFKVKK